MKRRAATKILLSVIVAMVGMFAGADVLQAACTLGASVNQWQCWEQTLTVSPSFGANPYRDYIIQVTFNHSVTGTTNQDVFWDSGNTFKIHAAFPPGTVTWGSITCTPVNPNTPCPSNLTWTPSSGTLTVNALTTNKNKVFDKGFLRQSGFYGYSPLYFWDFSEQFYWNGDTAWSAPAYEASGLTAHWGAYIQDRRAKNFNVTLVAPAALYQTFPAGKGPFTQLGSCSSSNPVPNDCSVPNPTYWNNFDALISTANGTAADSAIIPLIAGLVDPVGNGAPYPCQSNAVAFSRYLAARMAGFAVMFSPGFDDKVSSTTACNETLTSVMNAIGNAVKSWPTPASWRVLLTNHLGGGMTCSDYQNFRGSGWMSFFLFQSGHAVTLPTNSPDPNDICPQAVSSSETPVQASLRRSWQMPWTLSYFAAQPPLPTYTPAMPAYNGEGPYDNLCLQTAGCVCPADTTRWCISNSKLSASGNYAAQVDVRYHERQAAFESLFSDAYGFTYGAQEVARWYFSGPITFSQALAGKAAGDMTNVFKNFTQRGLLAAHREWILNNGPDTATDGNFKKALASDGSSLVLAYMPAMPSSADSTLQISTSEIPGLSCSANGWTAKWFHAQDNAVATAAIACSTSGNTLTVTKPPNTECSGTPYDGQACDWVLQMQKTGSAGIVAQTSPSGQNLDVWADLSPTDGTSALYAQLAGPPGFAPAAAPVLVSPAGLAFQQSPRVTRVRDGYLLVWQADRLDGSMLGIFAQRLDPHGQPIGGRVQVNATTEGDQRDPSLDSSPAGNTLVVWTSHGQDGDLGGIYGRILDPSGSPVTDEFQVNAVTVGFQEIPQVASLPGGGFVVAWQTRAMDTDQGALSFRVFAGNGKPATDEFRIPAGTGGIAPRLFDVMPTPLGGFRLRWRSGGVPGIAERLLQQEFDAGGRTVAPASALQ